MMITVIHETSAAFNSNLISTLYTRNSRTSFAPFCIGQAPREFLNQRRRLQIKASSLVFPLLPFPIEQVLVPSEAKTIHLYETRYISLLEESLYRKSKLFVHVVLGPIGIGGASADASFATRYGCLVMIEKVEQLEVGAFVSIRGVGRVKTLDLKQNFTMVRSRIRYELIADERTRRETFKKRKRGLFKKLNELKVLCNIDVCGIVMNANGTQTEVWPSPPDASRVIQRFNDLPSSSKAVNMVDQIRYLRLNASRMSTNVEKESRKVRSLEKELLLAECLTKEEVNTGNSGELDEMIRLLDRKIGMIDHRIAEIGPSSSSMGATAKGRNIENYHRKGK